jgi:hypothetical protein
MRRRLDDSSKSFTIRSAVTLAAMAIAAVHLSRPTVKIDGVLLGLLAVAVVPWLGSIFESVEGAGWKLTYRTLRAELDSTRDELQTTKGEVASARQRADFIESVGVTDLRPSSPAEEMLQLIRRYDSVRENMKSGPQRTKEMTDVVRHLTLLAPKLGDVDWSAYLASQDGGERIAAYSYFYAEPRPGIAPELTYALTNLEDKPFGQYWAIRALGRIAGISPSSVQGLVPIWQDFLAKLPVGTDRYYELSNVIDSLGLGRP